MTTEINCNFNNSTLNQNGLSQEQISTLAQDANVILFSSFYDESRISASKEDVSSLLENSSEYSSEEDEKYFELADMLQNYTEGEGSKDDCINKMFEIFEEQNAGYSNEVINAIEASYGEIGVTENLDSKGWGDNAGEALKYGGNAGDAWCVSFVSWLYGDAQNSDNSETFGYECGVSALMQDAIDAGYYESKDTYSPEAGDIMILASGGESHAGFVYDTDENYIYTIEGNKVHAVREVAYDTDDSYYQNYVSGYVKMSEWLDDSEQSEINTEFLPETDEYIEPDAVYYVASVTNGSADIYTSDTLNPFN